jgi:hypothetical protein
LFVPFVDGAINFARLTNTKSYMNKFTKFLVGAVAALALTLVVSASASAAYIQTGTLKMGSKGSQVIALQQTLNMTACKVAVSGVGSAGLETSTFAGKTKAAVECFQASMGLKADGVVGPMTGAKLAAITSSSDTTLPAGCSTNTGYSTTTGTPCSGTPSTTVFPAGCISSTGFSSTTGVSCATGAPSTGGVVTSGPFSINSVTPVSGYLSTQVAVGTQDKVIGDLRIIAGAGGTGSLTGVNVSFYNRGNGDYQFIKYASAVSVWLNGVKVGTLPASSFTQYNSQYSAFIPVSGANLNPSTTNDLQLSVSALPVIDSANLGATHNTFAFELQTLRYTDSTGSFSYTVPSGSQFDNGTITAGTLQSSAVFANASSANSITLTVTKDVNDSTDHVVAGQTSSNTTNVSLAMLDLTAQGDTVSINRLPVTLTVTNSGTGSNGSGAGAAAVINTLRLYNAAGVQLDSETVPASTTGVDTQVITFQNLTLKIPVGTTQVFTIKGDLNPVDGTVVIAGATASVAFTTPTSIQAYDSNNNVLSNTNGNVLLGTTTGSVITFYVNAINVASTGSASNTYQAASSSQTHGTFSMSIPFSVAAYGQTAYIPHTAVQSTAVGTSTAIQFAVDNGTNLSTGATAVLSYNGSDNLTVDANGNYMIPVGQTKNFTLNVIYTPSTSGLYRATLINIPWNLTDSSVTYSSYTAGLNASAFKTGYVSGQ